MTWDTTWAHEVANKDGDSQAHYVPFDLQNNRLTRAEAFQLFPLAATITSRDGHHSVAVDPIFSAVIAAYAR